MSLNMAPLPTKGQLISKCPSSVNVLTKIPAIYFKNFRPILEVESKRADMLIKIL